MRIGFDIDGVLANFVKSYQTLIIKETGKDLFAPDDVNNPPCWDWPQYRGYTDAEIGRVWGVIKRDETFWMNLEPHADSCASLIQMLRTLERKHELYFITARVGPSVKQQTRIWLFEHLHYFNIGGQPTVLISGEKGEVAHALKLDAYVDDNFDNAVDVVHKSPTTNTYLLNKSYNVGFECHPVVGPSYTRIDTVGQMFDKEIAKGRL